MKRREMLKSAALLSVSTIFSSNTVAPINPVLNKQNRTSNIKKFGDGRDWFFEKRYGMFVHWGIYSIPAWHEQYQWRGHISRSKYVKYAKEWNPKKFNPEQWLDLMQEAGMEYLTFTTKHHDGFCMWDTKFTKFNTMNTPYNKDILGILTEACHKRKVPLCLYYSIVDWNHPNYPNRGRHHELSNPEDGDRPDWDLYMEFLKGQVKELCTNYGEIHGFWWDMNVPKYKDPSINNMIRELQPKAVINNRGFDEGDFGTPERDYDPAYADKPKFLRLTEACQSVGMESWGYRKNEDYYSYLHLIRSINKYLARGANYLLNVGPNHKGEIDQCSQEILKWIGQWYKQVEESFNRVVPIPEFTTNKEILATRKGNVVYIHLVNDPIGNTIKLRPINTLPQKATLLNTGEQISCVVELLPSDHASQEKYLRLRELPVNKLANATLVVKLEF